MYGVKKKMVQMIRRKVHSYWSQAANMSGQPSLNEPDNQNGPEAGCCVWWTLNLIVATAYYSIDGSCIFSLLGCVLSSHLVAKWEMNSLWGRSFVVGLGPRWSPPDLMELTCSPIEAISARGQLRGQPWKLTWSSRPASSNQKSVESGSGSIIPAHAPELPKINGSTEKSEGKLKLGNGVVEEKDWSEGDVEVLRKLLGKHPVGKPGRWEAIAEGFKGRHRVESVIKKAKELGEKRTSNEDSYQKFLKDRKQVDKRIELENSMEASSESTRENESVWSSTEDLALLSALKAFPKDVAMRWEKIAAAVPGKTKAACMKRVTDLKRDFRSSKAAIAEA
nr:transcription factor MAMYB-like [Ipomoea batatas]